MQFDAHFRRSDDGTPVHQTLEDHCRHTANYAAGCLSKIGLHKAAYLSGLMHDAGKYKIEFQRYLNDEHGGRGTVNHTFAGCRMLLEHFHGDRSENYEDVTAELLAYAVGAHHGLFDCMDFDRKSGFLHRMQKENIYYQESRDQFLSHCAGWEVLEALFRDANQELTRVYKILTETAIQTEDDTGAQFMFSLGQLARLLLSSVIEGDRRDTAEFMNGIPPRKETTVDSEFWKPYLDYAEQKISGFSKDTNIQLARQEISNLCRSAAERSGGVYRLNVPTGSGKTLSSLRYALAHAHKCGKERIIFVTPLLTILEQNAAVIHEFIGDDSIILEHHSNIVHTEENGKNLDFRELAAESWDAPVIITTMVQLLNTMFLGKTTAIRRYHALCNAVVVIDEVQTVPNKMLSLFNTAVNFLSAVCGTTFLLCSATQPCFEYAEHPLHFSDPSEVVPYQERLWKPFRRTKIQDSGSMKLDQIPDFAEKILQEKNSLMIICNKKNEAQHLYQKLASEAYECFHLSSAMCMAHRRDVLKQVEISLKQGKKTVCVATQVMEAGVDISFSCVIRLAAGLDSIVQSAGRCNRNGESSDEAPVYIVQCIDEDLRKLREIREGRQATLALLNEYRRLPERFENDLSSDKAVSWYYHKLYSAQPEGYQQFAEGSPQSIFEMMAGNDSDMDHSNFEKYTLNQAFKTAGERFYVLDNSTEDVIVPYGPGKALIEQLAERTGDISPAELKKWVLKAKPYAVSLYEYQKEKLGSSLVNLHGVLVLPPQYYDIQTGLITKPESIFLEV